MSEIRQRERELGMTGKGRGEGTVSFPELRRGGVGLFIATLLARLLRPNLMPAIQRYELMEAAYAAAHGQMAYYRALEQQGVLRWIKDAAEPRRPRPRLATRKRQDDEPLGFILSMEGADPVLSPEQVEEWWQAGLRIIGPAHYGVSPYAHGTGTEGGLFPQGPALLKEMERVGMILDVTHLSDQCFDEALDIYGGPVLASHHNCRALVPDQRQLTDDQIKRLIQRGARHRRGPGRLDAGARLGARRDAAGGSGRDAGDDGRSHRPRLPARRQRTSRGHRHRPRRRLRPRAIAARPRHHRRPAALAGSAAPAAATTTTTSPDILHGNWVRFFRQALRIAV